MVLGAALCAICAQALAQPPQRAISSLPECSATTGYYSAWWVTDAVDSQDCTAGGGSARVLCRCEDGGTPAWTPVLLQGPQGAQGPQGTQGATGSQGPQGDAGAQGSQGPQGTQGIQGPAGNDGAAGAAGAQGPQGIQGIPGDAGATGSQGIQGIQGPAGADGADGAQGPQGIQGPEGPPGGGASVTRINAASGAAGADLTWQKLASNCAANSTTTLATCMTTTGVGAGTWSFRYLVLYQAGATTTGVDFAINHTGTAGAFVASSQFTSTGGAAATGLADQVLSNTANMVEGKSARALNTKFGSTLGVDTVNANMLVIIEGLIVVTGSGSLELRHASEVAASSQVMANTILLLSKIG